MVRWESWEMARPRKEERQRNCCVFWGDGFPDVMSGHLIIEMRIFDALQFCNSQEQPHSQPMASPVPLLKGSPVVSRPAFSPSAASEASDWGDPSASLFMFSRSALVKVFCSQETCKWQNAKNHISFHLAKITKFPVLAIIFQYITESKNNLCLWLAKPDGLNNHF